MTTITSLLKRVERIEAKQSTGSIIAVVNFTGCAEIAAEAVTNWRQWVKDGRANRLGDTLVIHAPTLTVEEWIATYSP
ncbi:hypothetical protein [Methylobacterium iners]|uniref:Uncharacterized protein n=1 Tax=Methylobacterium iners TaxID=418707 RepID=A0ABQ4S391_9HYPH|nr:hypothetical protein [Methylobacterium iners]GJD97351.1 hypothetical protein OCOJLMKI_4580 [Methylobacterium iners]